MKKNYARKMKLTDEQIKQMEQNHKNEMMCKSLKFH